MTWNNSVQQNWNKNFHLFEFWFNLTLPSAQNAKDAKKVAAKTLNAVNKESLEQKKLVQEQVKNIKNKTPSKKATDSISQRVKDIENEADKIAQQLKKYSQVHID